MARVSLSCSGFASSCVAPSRAARWAAVSVASCASRRARSSALSAGLRPPSARRFGTRSAPLEQAFGLERRLHAGPLTEPVAVLLELGPAAAVDACGPHPVDHR